MRTSVSMFTFILVIATAPAWLGWSAVTARAQSPGACQVSDTCIDCGAPIEQEVCEELIGDCCGDCCPCWTFRADGVAVQRSTTRSQALFRNSWGTTGVELLNSQNMNFPTEVGPQVSATRHGPCGWDLEVAYFQVDGWAANAVVDGTSYMVTDVNGANFIVTDAQARYTSAFYVGEINLRREWFDGLTLLAGFRMGELDEFYGSYGLGARSPVPVSLDVNTFNHLYGFQLGADWEFYNMGGPLRLNALCKAGIYANAATQSIRQIDTGSTDETLSATRDQAAFIGEAGLAATYQVTRRLAFRASYQAVWLEGVALAPEQISATNFTAGTATVDTHGGIFYYGGGLGLEYRF